MREIHHNNESARLQGREFIDMAGGGISFCYLGAFYA